MSYPKKPPQGSKDREAYTASEVTRSNKKEHLKTLLVHRMKSLLTRNHNVELTANTEAIIQLKVHQFVDNENFSENGLKGLVQKILVHLNGDKLKAATESKRSIKKTRNSHLEGMNSHKSMMSALKSN
jgi:hypothetical protein